MYQDLFRPYIYRELPGWSRLLRLLNIAGIDNTNPLWRDAPTRLIVGKRHGYLMELDLRDDLERITYFMGRYYDIDIQILIDTLLKPGDTFLDIGANIGMTTLHAARRVGRAGKVISFEPQPACCKKIRRNLHINDIEHVELHAVGLSDQDAELVLKILGGGSIMACFGENIHDAREEIRVPVRRGDDLVRGKIVGGLTVKIDVEGFELFALKGLRETIRKYRPPIIAEVIPHHLKRAGCDVADVFEFFHALDYRGHQIEPKKKYRFEKPVCLLKQIDSLSEIQMSGADILWLPASYELSSEVVHGRSYSLIDIKA
jgi:FkbM family methyltransferase